MFLHPPFGDLLIKLWSKELLGVKLAIWFPTIKTKEISWSNDLQIKYVLQS
jgi:hypothetical protein